MYFFSRKKTQRTSNFRAHLYVFEGGESKGDKHTELASSVDLENPDQLPVKEVFEDIMMIVSQILNSIQFTNHFVPPSLIENPLLFISSNDLFDVHVFEVMKSIADIPTELPCLGDLEIPGPLPVQEVLEGTDDSVL